MALKLGSLYVSLSANTGAFMKSMDGAMKAAERFAAQTKKVAAEAAHASAIVAGLGSAALKLASSVDGPTKTALDGLQRSAQLLAVQVADVLLPAVRALSEMFRHAAGVVAGLDPSTKAQAASFAVMAVQVAVAAKALSVFAGVAGNVIGVMRGLLGAVTAIGLGPLLGIVSALALVAAGIAALHYAWRTNLGGIADAWKKFADWFGSSASDLFAAAGDWVNNWVADFLGGLREMTYGLGLLMNKLGSTDAASKWFGLSLAMEDSRKKVLEGGFWDSVVTQALDLGKAAGSAFVDEWKRIAGDLGVDGLFKQGKVIGLGRGTKARDMAVAGGTGLSRYAQAPGVISMRDTTDVSELLAQSADLWERRTEVEQQWLAELADAKKAAVAEQWRQVEWQVTENQRIAAKAKAAANIMLSGLGALGQAINNIAQGAQSGGVWGALIAAVMEVFSRMEGFQQMLKTLERGLGRLGEFLGPLLEKVFGLVETLTAVGTEGLGPLFGALQPLFDGLASFAKRLVPVLSWVNTLFSALAPVIELVANLVGGVFDALGPLLDIIGGVVKVIATVVMGILIGLNELAAAFGDEKAKAESARLKALVDKIWAPGANELASAEGDAAAAAWRNAEAQNAAATAATKATESLTNVPSGYRVALARYEADLGMGGAAAYAAAGGGTTINGDVYVTSDPETVEDLAEDARREAARERGQQRGNPSRPRGTGGRD